MNENNTKNFRMPASHPILCELTIDVMKWHRFQQLNDYTPATCILDYDEPEDGEITVYVACASEDVKEALEEGWN